MKLSELLKNLNGIHTINSVMLTLNVSKEKAIYYIYRLKKAGYVRTKRSHNKLRIYDISSTNKLKGTTYYNIINDNSPIKIEETNLYMIYGREPTFEETLIFAIKTKNLRTILASLALFRKIKNWELLYYLSTKNNILRQVGALYDLSRLYVRTRKMPKKYLNKMLPKEETYMMIIPNITSKDFINIEEKWKVFIPFNKSDLKEYEELK